MSTELDDFLEHHGVLGMHWGKRKLSPKAKRYRTNLANAKANKKSKTPLNSAQKRALETHESRKNVAKAIAFTSAALGVRGGATYLSSHPEKISQGSAFIKKSILGDPNKLKYAKLLKDGTFVITKVK